jgi:hypothetical protein
MEAHLKAVDSSLPKTSADNFKICYYFDLQQICSGGAISALLHVPVTWAPTASECSTLLGKQLHLLETAANSVFTASIKSAATAGVTDFELLTQSWVLRAEFHELIAKYAAFVELPMGYLTENCALCWDESAL